MDYSIKKLLNIFHRHNACIMFMLLLGICFATMQANNPFLSELLQKFFLTAGFGMAWAIMANLTGRYSFGHALYSGITSYLTIFMLINLPSSYHVFILFLPLIIGIFFSLIFLLKIHFKIEHAYFTLLSISFLEYGRLFFENTPWFGKTNGLFLPKNETIMLLQNQFTWVLFILIIVIYFISVKLEKSDFGLESRAIKESRKAAFSIGLNPYHSTLFAMFISCLLTALIGVIFVAHQSSLFPEEIFSQQRSINIILAPIIGGVTYSKGPILGAFVLTLLTEIIDWIVMDIFCIDLPGIKHIILGCLLLAIIIKAPDGLLSLINKKRLSIRH